MIRALSQRKDPLSDQCTAVKNNLFLTPKTVLESFYLSDFSTNGKP